MSDRLREALEAALPKALAAADALDVGATDPDDYIGSEYVMVVASHLSAALATPPAPTELTLEQSLALTGGDIALIADLTPPAPTEDATVPNLNAQGVDMTQPMKVTSRDHPHTGEERDTLVAMVHDALASTFGCNHPPYHPSACEVVADTLIYGPRATMNHHAPPPIVAEPHGE